MGEMKGNVRARDGQWHYRFNFRGREYSGATGLDAVDENRAAAERVAAERRAEVERATARPLLVAGAKRSAPATIGGSTPFEVAAEAFLQWARDVEYASKPSTAERLRVSFQSAIEFFGSTEVAAVAAASSIEAYKEHRLRVHEVKDVTLRHDLHALSVFFARYAVRRGMAPRNPVGRGPDGVRQVSIPSDRDARRDKVVSAEEERKYFAAAARLHALHLKSFEAAQPNMADLARLMVEQGARPEELLVARVESLDLAAGTLRIEFGKTRAARRVLYLTPASLEILKRRAGLGSEWLFPSERHPGHHLGALNTSHDRICLNAGVSFTIYAWRHTFATRKIEGGAPVPVVAAILGHAGLQTVWRYVHPTAEAQRAAMVGRGKAVGE